MIELAVLALAGLAIVMVVRREKARAATGSAGAFRARRDAVAVVRGAFTYAIAFAGLMAVLYAASSLLAIVLGMGLLHGGQLMSASDLRTRASFSLAALIVGLPLWGSLWTVAQRRAAQSAEDRDAGERRLFLAAIFATTAVVSLFALQTVLHAILTLPGPLTARPSSLDGIQAGARLLVYGAAWAFYARLGWRERGPRAVDEAHDLAVYVLSGCALVIFAIGATQAVHELIGAALGIGQPVLSVEPGSSAWNRWGGVAASLLAGGAVWGATWRYDTARLGSRLLRVVYLYVVLLTAVPAALGVGTDGLYEMLRRLFGYHDVVNDWGFLADALPLLLVSAAIWAYHWAIVRRQAGLVGATTPPVPAGVIAPPRRPALALLSALGIAMVTPALISLLWLALDAVLQTGGALSGGGWWRDRASISLAAALVGAGAWVGGWLTLQRAASVAPALERSALARRLLLAGIVLAGGLSALGFTIAVLWLALRMLLGDTLDASTVSTALKELSGVAVLAVLTAYYGLTLRRDLNLSAGIPHRERIRVVALMAPGADAALAELRRSTGLRVEVAGWLAHAGMGSQYDAPALQAELVALGRGERGRVAGAFIVLGPDGGLLYPYHSKESAPISAVQSQAAAGAAVVDGHAI